ncbi:hypothetical protein [Carnobacterium divergens]|uniref:hypothetical protein n=1 Tax=Carnobacterium divergens TaxID=2748 RepID=UPI00288DF0DC|nr:hypothetical protein [Carnobacterium divergens]MDT2012584.1 hypothetical protein [Carnobacterium divergens]
MDKFELYERVWKEIGEEKNFLPDKQYTEKEYQVFKALFEKIFDSWNYQSLRK